jgi:hypothetical protein
MAEEPDVYKPIIDTYLGDGVYCGNDNYQIWLAVDNHHNIIVALDRNTFAALIEYGNKFYGVSGAKS